MDIKITNAVDYYLDGSIPYAEVGIALGIRGDTTDEELTKIAIEQEKVEVKDDAGDRIIWAPRSFGSLCMQVRDHVRAQENAWINVLTTWVKLLERDQDVEVKDRIRHVKTFTGWDQIVEHWGYEKAREILESIDPMSEAEKHKARIVFHLAACTGRGFSPIVGIVQALTDKINEGAGADQIVDALQGIEIEKPN